MPPVEGMIELSMMNAPVCPARGSALTLKSYLTGAQ
jgi:hypothetical protein